MNGSKSIEPGTVLDRKFRICVPVGTGNGSSFFVAEHLLLSKKVLLEIPGEGSTQVTTAKLLASGTADGAPYVVYEFDSTLSPDAIRKQLDVPDLHPDLIQFVKSQRTPLRVHVPWKALFLSALGFACIGFLSYFGVQWWQSCSEYNQLHELEKRVAQTDPDSPDMAPLQQKLAQQYLHVGQKRKAAEIYAPLVLALLRERKAANGSQLLSQDYPLLAAWVSTEPDKCPGLSNDECFHFFLLNAGHYFSERKLDDACHFYDLAVRFSANAEGRLQGEAQGALIAYNTVAALIGKPDAVREAMDYYFSKQPNAMSAVARDDFYAHLAYCYVASKRFPEADALYCTYLPRLEAANYVRHHYSGIANVDRAMGRNQAEKDHIAKAVAWAKSVGPTPDPAAMASKTAILQDLRNLGYQKELDELSKN